MGSARFLVASMAVIAAQPALAGNVTGLTTFTAGTPAKASEVNGNFAAVKTAVDDNAGRIAALESAVSALQSMVATLQANLASTQSDLAAMGAPIKGLQSQLADIQASNVMALEPYLSVTTSGVPRAFFSGINLQLVNGTGYSDTVNGKGNLIIGYDEVRGDATYRCSNGAYSDQPTCVANGGTWAVSHKSGSHYLVVGRENNYSQYGGLVVGYKDSSTGGYASVMGFNNTASGGAATVSGGYGSTASGGSASVSGGMGARATGAGASVSGGFGGVASATYSSVSGGSGNTAGHNYSSVLGGPSQTTTSAYQTIPALP